MHNHLGLALQERGKLEAAAAQFQQALAIKPNGIHHNNLGCALRDLGRLEEAHRAFKKAIDLAPERPLIYLNMLTMKRIEPGDPELLAMEKLSSESRLLSVDDRISLHFALGKAYGDLKDHERSFHNLREGNALKRQQISYDDTSDRNLFDRIREVFTPELMRDKCDLGDPSRIPVFIVGMPAVWDNTNRADTGKPSEGIRLRGVSRFRRSRREPARPGRNRDAIPRGGFGHGWSGAARARCALCYGGSRPRPGCRADHG